MNLRSLGAWTCAGVALAIVLIGLLTILDSGWRDPYADQWRMYPFYLELPFPDSVLQLENGHRPILPGLVRVAELHWLGGSQILQLAVGALAALATVLLLAWIAVADRSLTPTRRWLAVAASAAALFWLGNGRFLLHGNESVHGYLLTFCATAALALVLRPGRTGRLPVPAPTPAVTRPGTETRLRRLRARVIDDEPLPLFAACLLAMAAAFCFGPGIASFGAVALVLVLDRRYRALPMLGCVLALTLLLYFLLPDADGIGRVLHIEPLANLGLAAAWLASMWAHLLQALHDPEAARALPGWLAAATAPVARAYQANLGSLWLRHGPAMAIGLAAIGYIVVVTLISLRAGQIGLLRRCGLALSWFAIAVAGLVALSRLEYFQAHPDQVLAQRYLPWSSLFWLGVLLTALATPARSRLVRVAPMIAVVVMIAGMLASTPAYRSWGQRVQDGLALQAAGIAVGSLAQDQPLWETRMDEVVQVRPMLERQRKAMFAWPEMELARAPAPPQISERSNALMLTAELVDNRFGGQALALSAHATEPSSVQPRARRLLVTDADGRALGLLVRQRDRRGVRYAGYAWPGVEAEAIATGRLLAISASGIACLAGCPRPP